MCAKHKPPSRERYEKNNPNWTVRMPLQWHEDYEKYVNRFGLSRRDFMGASLKKIKLDYEQVKTQSFNQGVAVGRKQGYDQGHNEGYVKGKEEGRQEGRVEGYKLAEKCWKIELCCPGCGEIEEVLANSLTYQMLIDFLYYYGWMCRNCQERRFYR